MGVVGFCLIAATVALGQQTVGWDEVRALLSSDDEERRVAIENLREHGDPSLLAGLNDILYYYYVVRQPERANEIDELMTAIAGEGVGDNPRRGWVTYVGKHEEISPRRGYISFKRSVYERYDPAFRGYFNPRFTFRIRPEEIEWGGVRKDGIPALDNPGFIQASEADYLDDDDRVFGVRVNGETKAYPHLIMDAHEMCNDVVGGVPVSLSYCTLCGSGILFNGAHASRSGKKPFTFGSSGLLYRSNKLMYDRPTNSLWSNITGEPVAGRLAESGVLLEKLPLVVSTWGEWKKKHPESLVLDPKSTGFPRDYSESPYEAYFASDETMFPVWLRSDSLRTKERVYALVIHGRPKAYPVEILRQERITHDTLGGEQIVLITNPRSGAVRAYRTRGSRFTLADDGTLREEPDGEVWEVREEHLLSRTHEELDRIPGHDAFWFGWYAFYPTTEIYEGRAKP